MNVKCTSQIAVFTLLFFAIFMDVEAQSFSCPDNFNENDWTLVREIIGVRLKSDLFNIEATDKFASIPYYYTQGSGNNFIVLIDWNTLTNNMKPISDKTAKDLIMMRIAIFNFNGGFPCNGNTNPQDVYLVNFVSQAQCSVTTSCLSLLKYDDEIPCPNHSELQDRIIRNNLNGEGYWRQFRTKPCGFKCCLTTVKFTCGQQPATSGIVPVFLPLEYVSLSECPEINPILIQCPSPMQDPPPTIILPCVGDCQKGELK